MIGSYIERRHFGPDWAQLLFRLGPATFWPNFWLVVCCCTFWPNFWLTDPIWSNFDWLSQSGPISDWLSLSGQSGPIWTNSDWLAQSDRICVCERVCVRACVRCAVICEQPICMCWLLANIFVSNQYVLFTRKYICNQYATCVACSQIYLQVSNSYMLLACSQIYLQASN